MKAASLKELKTELEKLYPEQILNICMRLAKYKKDNKELLTYLLFSADDEQEYIKEVKILVDEQFAEMNKSNIYFSKKTVRKALRTVNKFMRYSGSKQIEVELLIYFCNKIKDSGIAFRKSTALNNLYQRQILRINKAMKTLHEDLQYDYSKEIESLS
jgi:hypothetical protein